MNEDLRQLRKKIDSDDPFMNRGFQVKKIRTREKVTPVWAISNVETQKLLLRAFPKLKTGVRQRARAARWASVIHLFYRMNVTKSGIAAELNTSTSNINLILQHIRRVARGRRADNTGPLGVKPIGRPKKA